MARANETEPMPTPADTQTDRAAAPFELDDPTDPQNLEAVAIRDSDKNITPAPAPTVDLLLKGMDDEPPKSRAKPRASPRAFAAGQKAEAHEPIAPPAPYRPADEPGPVLINQTAPLGTRLPQSFAEDARETVRNAPRRPSPDTLNRLKRDAATVGIARKSKGVSQSIMGVAVAAFFLAGLVLALVLFGRGSGASAPAAGGVVDTNPTNAPRVAAPTPGGDPKAPVLTPQAPEDPPKLMAPTVRAPITTAPAASARSAPVPVPPASVNPDLPLFQPTRQ